MPEKPPPPRRRPTAAGNWVRSFHCKSMAADDVAARGRAAAPKKLHPLLPRAGCGSSGDAALTHVPSSKPTGRPRPKQPASKPNPETGKKTKPKPKPTSVVPPSPPPGPLGPVPALTELPAGHSSRQVVEIIFLSSWSPLPSPVPPPPPPQPGAPPTTSSGGAFPGVVEMLFRVHNPARAVARFEDYRAAVRARAGGAGSARSAADGNEMMRFSPAPPHDSLPSSATSAAAGGGDDAPRIRTFDGSGGAHNASARGPAATTGRRAMFLCRVIAGRVAEAAAGTGAEETKTKGQFDSVRVGKGGELVVFDRRAVLPCFLIIYRL